MHTSGTPRTLVAPLRWERRGRSDRFRNRRSGGRPPHAAAGGVDLEGLTRPLLEALARIAGLESTYLTVFDWDGREQEVRFVHRAGGVEIEEGSRLPLPPEVSRESLPGVTRSPPQMPGTHPDSQAARQLGLRTYVSVPVVLARHQLFGMICGASRRAGAVSEPVVSVMEFFAGIVADHITRERVAATEQLAATAEEQRLARPATSPWPSISSRHH